MSYPFCGIDDPKHSLQPLYLVAEQGQLQILQGGDVPPVKSDKGMFMRTVPMQSAVIVDEAHSQRMLDVSNRIPPDQVRLPEKPGKKTAKRKVGMQPQLHDRMEADTSLLRSPASLGSYVLPDAEYMYPSTKSSSMLLDSANKFYLFSISLIGLYMFYRIMRLSAESKLYR
jgi:hypothetical protein